MAAVAGALYEFQVLGQCDGQAVDNILHYYISAFVADGPPADILQAFVDDWRGCGIYGLLPNTYRVTTFKGAKITGGRYSGGNANSAEFLRDDLSELAGAAGVDKGSGGADCLPTQNSYGIRKKSSGPGSTVYIPAGFTPLPGLPEKIFRGSLRAGPVPSVNADASPRDNYITAGTLTNLQAAADAMQTDFVAAGIATFSPCIASLIFRHTLRTSNGPTFHVAYQTTTAFIASELITSQVSRKQKSAAR